MSDLHQMLYNNKLKRSCQLYLVINPTRYMINKVALSMNRLRSRAPHAHTMYAIDPPFSNMMLMGSTAMLVSTAPDSVRNSAAHLITVNKGLVI